MKEMEYKYKWKCEDKFGSILRTELNSNEYFARMSPIVLAGPKKLYFNMSRLLILKSNLGYLIRAMRIRETNLYRMFDSDVIEVKTCEIVPLALLSFSKKPEMRLSLRGVVELRRKISDAFIDIKLSQKISQ